MTTSQLEPTSARLLAVALVALGIWIAASPASVPGLTQPSRLDMMQP